MRKCTISTGKKFPCIFQGWTMVFKAVSGNAKEPWKVFSSEFTSGEIDMKGLDLTNNFQKHYKSRIVLFWENFGPAQVKMWFQHFKEIQQNRRNGEKRQMKPGKKNRKRKSKDKRQNNRARVVDRPLEE
ncbi:uncharacterized protein LOC141889266 [Acropora palmata]|uniref:uncharacterized protein LOC141889266 n=1 Tax=Acropora palmata TaxID=6131 RepID=UPI003DA1A037